MQRGARVVWIVKTREFFLCLNPSLESIEVFSVLLIALHLQSFFVSQCWWQDACGILWLTLRGHHQLPAGAAGVVASQCWQRLASMPYAFKSVSKDFFSNRKVPEFFQEFLVFIFFIFLFTMHGHSFSATPFMLLEVHMHMKNPVHVWMRVYSILLFSVLLLAFHLISFSQSSTVPLVTLLLAGTAHHVPHCVQHAAYFMPIAHKIEQAPQGCMWQKIYFIFLCPIGLSPLPIWVASFFGVPNLQDKFLYQCWVCQWCMYWAPMFFFG